MKVHELLENPEHWTKTHAARDAGGDPISPDSDRARSWCNRKMLPSEALGIVSCAK